MGLPCFLAGLVKMKTVSLSVGASHACLLAGALPAIAFDGFAIAELGRVWLPKNIAMTKSCIFAMPLIHDSIA